MTALKKIRHLDGQAAVQPNLEIRAVESDGTGLSRRRARLIPGIQVARIDSGRYAITSRGFNGRFANKLLVLIDGRSVYTPLFSGVFWELQDTMMEDIDRIEVIRGPGARIRPRPLGPYRAYARRLIAGHFTPARPPEPRRWRSNRQR
jgi:iron complex outermembrane recepter protein